jgi:hypothetical protein
MNEKLTKITGDAKLILSKITSFASRRKFLTVFIIASAAVLAALLKSQAYINPTRNEARYEEEKLKINYSTIDQEIVSKLSKTQEDKNIEVDPQLVPNRSNPFSE